MVGIFCYLLCHNKKQKRYSQYSHRDVGTYDSDHYINCKAAARQSLSYGPKVGDRDRFFKTSWSSNHGLLRHQPRISIQDTVAIPHTAATQSLIQAETHWPKTWREQISGPKEECCLSSFPHGPLSSISYVYVNVDLCRLQRGC